MDEIRGFDPIMSMPMPLTDPDEPDSPSVSIPMRSMMAMIRNLASGGDPLVVDFTVLAMAVVTMVLLMIVAVVRHKVDQLAKGREIFVSVLEAVYHELSTLGIVEATIFLVHHYYLDLNIQVERVFAEVHFTLFFVAIINALMSTLLYFLTSHVADNHWVKLETVDIDHYVVVRKNFDAMEEQMRAIGDYDSRGRFPLFVDYLKKLVDSRYRELLVQVRFHELRVHFIESNNLDPRFKVSKYLKLCMNDVFKKLIDISTFSWLILLACTNILYFVTGVIAADASERGLGQESIGVTLSWVFIGYAVVFVVLSYFISLKMKRIFYKIMENEKWISRLENGNANSNLNGNGNVSMDAGDASANANMNGISLRNRTPSSREVLSRMSTRTSSAARDVSQVDYFWGSNPTVIVFAAQFMQFGYAIALSILLVFNKSFMISNSPIQWYGWYFLVPIVCFCLFVWLWSTIIPQYTQCTNLGELINEKHLNRTRASFELKMARKKRQYEIDCAGSEGNLTDELLKKSLRKKKPKADKVPDSNLKLLMKMIPGVTGSNRSAEVKDDLDLSSNDGSLRGLGSSSNRLYQLSELVKKESKDLPDIQGARDRLARRRKRSVSDGVAAMRMFSSTSASAAEALKNENVTDTNDVSKPPSLQLTPQTSSVNITTRTRPRRKKAVSTGVFFMQSEQTKPLVLEPAKIAGEKPTIIGSENTSDGKPPKSKAVDEMPKKLQQKKFIMPITEEDSEGTNSEHTDDNSVDISEGVPDIEEFAPEDITIGISERLKQMYISRSYRQASAVFGTMVVFFMIASRIELILLDTCDIADNQNTWNIFSRKTAFWIVVIWLSSFIIESVVMIILFYKVESSPHMVIAGSLDCLISVTCLIIFLKAEIDRCCSCDTITSKRNLASEPEAYQVCNPYHECCPRFGDRLCGGVGTLEPIVAIVALRLLRFHVGKKIWYICCKSGSRFFQSGTVDLSLTGGGSNAYNFDESGGEKISHKDVESTLDSTKHGSVDFKHETGTAAELWTLAISKYPKIVEEHGLYSGLLLEAMLGINPAPAREENKKIEQDFPLHPGTKNDRVEFGNVVSSAYLNKKPSHERNPSYGRQMSARSSNELSSLGENNNEDNVHNLIRPASALIRSMRRCQFKWLPLLDDWEVVDVVLTKYELVWLGPKPLGGLWDENIDKRRDEVNNKLRSLKGGKGMRLCDVIVGREVFGRLPLKDIEQIRVQKFTSGKKNSSTKRRNRKDVEGEIILNDFKTEFWTDETTKKKEFQESPDSRWARVTENSIIMFSPQGTLCLRFLVDLISEETQKMDYVQVRNDQPFGAKEGVFLWCQTISHLCGPRQLKQKLPNFGKGRDEELADFVETVERKKGGFMNSLM